MQVHDIFVLLNYVSVFVMFVCAIIICNQEESRMQKLALMSITSLLMCCIGFLIRIEGTNADVLIAGQKIVYAFVTHAMFFMLLFILEYCRFEIPKFIIKAFMSINILMSLIVLTLDHHNLFYKEYWVVDLGDSFVLEKEYGIMHTVAIALFGIYMMASLVIAILFTVKNIGKRKSYVWRLLIAVMLPCLSYIIPKLTDTENDFQPMAFALFSVIIIYMIYRNKLYDIDNLINNLAIDSMDDGFIVLDKDNRFMGCNNHALTLLPELNSASLDSVILPSSKMLLSILDGSLDEYTHNDKIYVVYIKEITDHLGKITGKVIRLKDETIEKKYSKHLETINITDELTGIKNRRAYEEKINEIKKGLDLTNVTIWSLDVNGLKEVNDSIGHAAGDEIIKGSAEILKNIFKPYGEVYRTGGDEFFVIIQKEIPEFKEIEKALLNSTNNWQGQMVKSLSISYGEVRSKDYPDKNMDELMIIADKKMYECKKNYYENSGKDRRRQK